MSSSPTYACDGMQGEMFSWIVSQDETWTPTGSENATNTHSCQLQTVPWPLCLDMESIGKPDWSLERPSSPARNFDVGNTLFPTTPPAVNEAALALMVPTKQSPNDSSSHDQYEVGSVTVAFGTKAFNTRKPKSRRTRLRLKTKSNLQSTIPVTSSESVSRSGDMSKGRVASHSMTETKYRNRLKYQFELLMEALSIVQPKAGSTSPGESMPMPSKAEVLSMATSQICGMKKDVDLQAKEIDRLKNKILRTTHAPAFPPMSMTSLGLVA